jgi:ribose transport system ATP-binding protein
MVEVCEICDLITVMRDGKLVTTTEIGVKSTPAFLASQMVGRPLSDFYPPKVDVEEIAPLLEIESASVEKFAHDVSFAVRPGEILGFSGLIGSGRTELCEAIAGLRRLKSGAIKLEGKPVQIRSPRMAKKAGIAYVSEDRKALGLHQMLSVIDNTTLSNLSAYGGISVDDAAQRASTEIWKERLDIRANDLDQSILFLSGGNQQKVSIAKWLDTKPRVLILDEPTRGVDVGAKREIYALIQQLAANGMACLVISSELTEVIGLCHRALVFREGRVVGEVFGDSMNEETMMHLAAGVDAA